MAYDKTKAVNVGRLATYDILIKDWVSDNFGTNIPNLLFNADFRAPVNRNGKIIYHENGSCAIDGWVINENIGTNQLTINNGYITFPAHAGFILSHRLGRYLSNLIMNKVVTLSCLTTAGLVYNTITVGSDAYGDIDTNGLDLIGNWHIDLWGKETDMYFRIFTPNGELSDKEVRIIAVKLEIGDHQTLARKNYNGDWEVVAPIDYARQYDICSQYSSITGEFIGYNHSNANMLDNWYFKNPVNRQNLIDKVVGEQWEYPIDRWFAVRTNLLLSNEGLSVGVTAGTSQDYCALQQKVRYNYFNTQYTVSAIINGELFSAVLDSPNGSDIYDINISPFENGVAFGLQSVTDGYMWVYIYIRSETPMTISAVKCELGAEQTLAHIGDDGELIMNDPPANYETEYVKCVQYDIITGDYIGLNSEAVQAVSKTGDYMTGDLVIEKESAPAVTLKNQVVETKIVVSDDTHATELVNGALGDEDNKAIFRLNRETSELKDSVQIERVVGGKSNTYKLYGEHNKPTAADLGIDISADLKKFTDFFDDLTDDDFDQLSEFITYITENRDLISKKVNVSDIVDNLTSTDTDKPLSAKQGNALKELISRLTYAEVGAAAADHSHSNLVPNNRTINGLSLDKDISLTAADLGITSTGDASAVAADLDAHKKAINPHGISLTTIGAAASDHTHNYAGSSSAGGAATSANKVNQSLSIQLNSGTATTFDGSAAKSINITPSAIGAATASHGTHLEIGTTATTAAAGNHTHTADDIGAVSKTGDTMTGNLSITDDAYVVKLRNDGDTWGLEFEESGKSVILSATSIGTVKQTITLEGSNSGTVGLTGLSNPWTDDGAVTRGYANATYAPASHGTHLEIGTTATTAAAGNHTHNYAGSSSAGGAATSANKVNSNLSIQLNGGTATTFDGSAAKSINITPSAIGAAPEYTYGTEDLTAGESTLTTGKLYFVYE